MAYTVTFPQGTQTIFNQPTAPVGWTKVTTFGQGYSVNGAAIRISSGNAFSGDGLNFETVFSNVNLTGRINSPSTGLYTLSPTLTFTVMSDPTVLTEAQIPVHNHLRSPTAQPGYGVLPATNPTNVLSVFSATTYLMQPSLSPTQLGSYPTSYKRFTSITPYSTYPASSGPYASPGSHQHSMSVTLTPLPTPVNFAMKYIDCIIASKD
jgi:microcystin-dependent protein